MNLTDADIAEVRAAIEEEGMPCVWEQRNAVPVDEDKPWLGTTDASTQTEVSIAFVDVATASALLSEWSKDSDVTSNSLFGMMGDYGFTPAIRDRVLRPTAEPLVAKRVMTAAPAGRAVYHVIEFSA